MTAFLMSFCSVLSVWQPSGIIWLAGPQARLVGPEGGTNECTKEQINKKTNEQTNKQDRKFPHSTGLRPLSGPLSKRKGKKRKKKENKAIAISRVISLN